MFVLKKNQVFVIDARDDIEVKMHSKAIPTKTESTKIITAFKISEYILFSYANSEALVEKLTGDSDNIIEINGKKLKKIPYVIKTKTVIFFQCASFH